MPQLEQIGTYLSQVFWLVVTFVLLYVILWKAALPRMSSILAARQERTDDDLRKAERFKKEADEAAEAYEKTVADARSRAQGILRKAGEDLTAEAAARIADLDEELRTRTEEATARIYAAQAEAESELREIAAPAAQAAAARLIGAEVSAEEAAAAVAKAMEERA